MSTETTGENKEPPRTITEEQYTGIGGWYSSLKNLKEDVDRAFSRFDEADFSCELFIEDAYVETSRQETEEEREERLVMEKELRQRDIWTIRQLAAKHGIDIKYE